MNCACRSNIEVALTERFAKQAPEATDHGVTLQGYGFGIGAEGMQVVGYMEAKASAIYPLKKGGTKLKTITQNMHFNYCPFCGAEAAPKPPEAT